jgi:hypothetical protein
MGKKVWERQRFGWSRLAPTSMARREGAEAKGGVLCAVLKATMCQGEKKGGVGMMADHFIGGGGVEQSGGGAGSGMHHAARRWGSVPARPTGGGRPVTARQRLSRAAPNRGGRGGCQVVPGIVTGGGVKRFKPFPKFN